MRTLGQLVRAIHLRLELLRELLRLFTDGLRRVVRAISRLLLRRNPLRQLAQRAHLRLGGADPQCPRDPFQDLLAFAAAARRHRSFPRRFPRRAFAARPLSRLRHLNPLG